MEVTDVEAIVLESAIGSVPLVSGMVERPVTVRPVIVRVTTDEGITGIGESFVGDPSGEEARFVAQGVRSLAGHLEGRDPRDVTQRWHEMYADVKRSGAFRSLSAIDEALWDVLGKDAGKPVYELLGGQSQTVSAYATFPHRKETEALVEDGAWLAEKGFTHMKIVVGEGIETDRKRIRRVAESLPGGFGLAIDANTSFTVPEALAVGRTAGEHDLRWFEEPIAHTDVEGMAELNRRLDVPISAYQTERPHYPAVDHLRANALEIYQPSLDLVGGITGGRRVAALVEGFNKRLIPHAFGPMVNYAATMHVAAASPACEVIEFAVYDDEIDDPGRYVASPYVENQDAIYVRDGGVIEPPSDPGLGVRLDEDTVEEMRVE